MENASRRRPQNSTNGDIPDCELYMVSYEIVAHQQPRRANLTEKTVFKEPFPILN
jgi:hypothetical protein